MGKDGARAAEGIYRSLEVAPHLAVDLHDQPGVYPVSLRGVQSNLGGYLILSGC